MAWIESHQELARHPKLKRLCRVLGIPRVQAIGHLHLLWYWAIDYAPDGDLSALAAEDIAEEVDWSGDASAFVAALVECGFLDRIGDRLTIHDNDDYNGRLQYQRERNRDKQRAWRDRQKDVTNTLPSRNGYVTGLPTKPTNLNQPTAPPLSPPPVNGAAAAVDFQPTYPTTLGDKWPFAIKLFTSLSPEFTDGMAADILFDVERDVGPLSAPQLRSGLEASRLAIDRAMKGTKPIGALKPYVTKIVVKRLREVANGPAP